MSDQNIVIFVVGSLFLLGLVADIIGRFTVLPRVTILLISGVVVGPAVLDLLPKFFIDEWFSIITDIALGMIGFLLGQKFTLQKFRKMGKSVFVISLMEVLGAFLTVFVILALLQIPLPVALLLATIAPASAPAAIYDVVKEMRIKNLFSEKVLGVVAIDDLWGLILFSLSLSFAGMLSGGESDWIRYLQSGMKELGGSLVLGVGFGLIVSWLTGRVQQGEPTQAEALGSVFLVVSIAQYFAFSPLLSAMVLGATVANVASHHKRPFEAIEGFEWPFLILFFLLAGASLHLDSLLGVGSIGIAYILARIAGLYFGSYWGATIAKNDRFTQKMLGVTLLPQAGVAVGMALMATQHYPEYKDIILPVVIGSTVFFELLGPIAARKTLQLSQQLELKE